MAEGEKIIQVNIEDEMKSAYIDYSAGGVGGDLVGARGGTEG